MKRRIFPQKAKNPGWFSKGNSGNPQGRPPAKRVAPLHTPALNIVLSKTLTATRNGVKREITLEEGLQYRTYLDAVAGKRSAQRDVLKWISKRETWLLNMRRSLSFLNPKSRMILKMLTGFLCYSELRP